MSVMADIDILLKLKEERELTEDEKAELDHLWECQNYINRLYGYPEHKELIELISDALADLTRGECPYCQAYIGIDRYLGEDDIEHWLNEKSTERLKEND